MSVLERSNETTEPSRLRWPMFAAAAAAVAIVIGVVAMLSRGDDESIPVTTVEPTITTPETVPPAQPVEQAQAAVADLVAIYNSGDTDAVLARMSDDMIWTENYDTGRPDPDGEPLGRDDVELRFAWNNAQGEQWTEAVCELADEQRPEGLTLDCTWDTLDALILAVDGTPIPTRALVVVDDGVVAELHFGYSSPDFAALSRTFDQWLEDYHPAEADIAGCCLGDTRAESVAMGEARAEWAENWSAFLTTYGCMGSRACTIASDRWVAEYDARCTTSTGGGLDAEAVAEMRALPPVFAGASAGAAGPALLAADEELLAIGLDDAQVEALQQARLDAMVELGIDEACHPSG